MFALEINFKDGSAATETVYVQRPHAIVGSSDYAHVVVGDLEHLPFELHLYRGIGRKFRTVVVPKKDHTIADITPDLEGEYETEAQLNLGPIDLGVIVLDTDLTVSVNEPLDKNAVRILRRATTAPSPKFPALALSGEQSFSVSFTDDAPIFVGRDRECTFRLDAPDVSGKHARVGYEDGQFWIEDLGSTNGTYIGGQQVSGKTVVPEGQPVIIGRTVVVYGLDVEGEENLPKIASEVELQALPEEKYPMLISLSEVARPPRMVLREGATVRIGREPSSDLWLGAPHVSRKHCTIECRDTGNVVLTDLSMNGLAYDGGVLTQGESIQLGERPAVLNFGGGVTVAICLSPDDERTFSQRDGSPHSFIEETNGTSSHHGTITAMGGAVPDRVGQRSVFGGSFVRLLKSLRLYQRIVLLLTIFLVLLAMSLALKLIVPLVMK